MSEVTVREARPSDADAVGAIAERTWTDREREDYIGEVFPAWVRAEEPPHRTVVADAGGTAVGVARSVLLGDQEAWMQGLRVHPDHRGAGLADRLGAALFDWARERGATVARNMVFSWNDAGLSQSLAGGFDPLCAVRLARPEPTPGELPEPVVEDPAAAWSFWTRSEARRTLSGVGLDPAVPWTVSDLTRDRLRRHAEDERVLAVAGEGTRGFTVRIGTRHPETEAGVLDVVEYAAAGWTDADAAETLFAAVRADAAGQGADQARVLVPETPRHVAETARARGLPADEPVFVFEADLTRQP